MLFKFSRYLTIAALATLTCVITNQVQAQENNPNLLAPTSLSVDVIRPGSTLNLSGLMNQAFWQNSGDFFDQASIVGQLNFLFGWGNFPEGSFAENSVARDSLLMYVIVSDYFKQLQQREPTIRTRDINNPFETSVQENPDYVR
jgi:hypothetical protein